MGLHAMHGWTARSCVVRAAGSPGRGHRRRRLHCQGSEASGSKHVRSRCAPHRGHDLLLLLLRRREVPAGAPGHQAGLRQPPRKQGRGMALCLQECNKLAFCPAMQAQFMQFELVQWCTRAQNAAGMGWQLKAPLVRLSTALGCCDLTGPSTMQGLKVQKVFPKGHPADA